MAKREVELQSGSMTVTDHGTMSACRQVYSLAKKNKLIPILGVEGFFRDDNCSILSEGGIERDEEGTTKEYNKYYHCTIHFRDQEAYETGARILSEADAVAERHGSERKPMFNWAQLEEIGAKNTTITSSCLVGMVQRHLLADRPDLAIQYYEKLRSVVRPGSFLVELFPHRTDKQWVKGVFIKVEGQEKPIRYHFEKRIKVEVNGKLEETSAEEFAKKWYKKTPEKAVLVQHMYYRKWQDFEEGPRLILNVEQIQDFVQNECSDWAPNGDSQRGTNEFLYRLARRYGDLILISDDSHFAHPDDKVVQDIRLLSLTGGKDSWRFYGSYHRQSSAEAYEYFKREMGTTEAEFESWVENSKQWADGFKDFKFVDRKELPTKFYPKETLEHTFSLINKHGRMNWSDPVMCDRLEAEIRMLHENGVIDLLPYFFTLEEAVSYCIAQGRYTGAGRGSAAGLLLSYVLGITHINPLKYDLSRERFLTEDRIKGGKLPDIDQDLAERDLIINPDTGWLKKRFGDHYAQISTDTQLRLKSSIKDVHRVRSGYVLPEIEALTKKMPIPPQGISDRDFVFGYKDSNGDKVRGISETDPALMQYIDNFPEEWAIVCKCLGITRNKSRHACAYVVANEPIHNFLPLTTVSDYRVTQYTASWVEEAGGIKMDFLGLNTLKDIEACVRLVQERAGYVQKDETIGGIKVPGMYVIPDLEEAGGQLLSVWDLPEDQPVFKDICSGNTPTVFQFNTPAARQWLTQAFWNNGDYALKSIEGISAFTALDRPGPLDAKVSEGGVERNMLEEFAARARGEKPIGNNDILDKMFPETYGIIVYQEQLQKAFQVIGKTTGTEADNFRIHISKKKMSEVMKDKDLFMPGAIETVGEQEAQRLWDMMETFGQYGFNKSHAVCYAYTGYVCAWLKRYYPLEWWTAVLRNAERNEVNNNFWQYCGHLIDPPDIKLSGDTFEIQNERIRAPLSLLNGIGPTAHEELLSGRPYDNLADFLAKLYQRRKERGTVVVKKKEKKDRKTKEVTVTEEKFLKLGRSALNKTIIAKLIISGSMDSFFPEGLGVPEKMNLFFETKAQVEGKKKPDEIDMKFINITALQRYVMRKEILPAFADPLAPLVANLNLDNFGEQDGRYFFKLAKEFQGSKLIPVVSGDQLRMLEGKAELLSPIKVAVAAYVYEVKRFWQNKAVKVSFEVDGERFEYNKWPSGKDRKPVKVPEGCEKAVCLLTLTRFNESKPFTLDDIEVVQTATSDLPEEASAE